MPSTVELEKLQSTLDYFKRYYEFGDAISVYQENRRYLGTYIHSRSDVEEQFGLRDKLKKAMLISLGAGAVCGLIALLIAGLSDFGLKNIIAFVVTAAVVFVAASHVLKNIINKKFLIKWEEQKDVNVGLTAQVEDLEKRCQALEKQQKDYLSALEEKKLAHIPVKYIEEAETIADYVRNDKAETVEAAVKMHEDMLAAKKAEEEEKARRAAELRVAAQKKQELQKKQEAEKKQSNPFLKLGASKPAQKSQQTSAVSEKSTSSGGLKLSMSGRTAEKKPAVSPASKPSSGQSIENEIGLELQRVLGASVSPAPTTSSRSSRKPAATLSINSFTERKHAEELAAQKAAAISEDPIFKAVMAEEPAPVVEEVAPIVEEVSPVVEEVAPVVEEVAPIAEEVTPIAEEVTPIAEEVAPIVEEVAPIVEEIAPIVEEIAPVAEEVAPIVEEAVVEQPKSFSGLSMSSFNSSKSASQSTPVADVKPAEPAPKTFSGLSMSSFGQNKPKPAAPVEEATEIPQSKPSSGFLRMSQSSK